MKIELIKISENDTQIIYKINQEFIEVDGKIFKVNKCISNLTSYLKSKNIRFLDVLNESINNKCNHCLEQVEQNRFRCNKFITYKFCRKCNKSPIRKKYDIIQCSICGKDMLRKDSNNKTCGDENCLKTHFKNVGEIIKETHWSKSKDKNDIIERSVATRLENDKKLNRKYTPWNKGKTNIYSKETIEKIRAATIKQMKEGRIRKSSIEIIFENFLKENNINYIYSFIYKKRQYDFLLIDFNLVVELQGDYWHANPLIWDVNGDDVNKKTLYETQKMKLKDDDIKKNIINESEYNFVVFWENDIHKNFIQIIKTLENEFNIKINNK